MTSPPPLAGIKVLEFAGLAPGPFAGLLLADYGASVLRIDRSPAPTGDQLTRHKSSICINLKSPSGTALLKALIPHVDVVIDPFRPGVLEKLGLGPEDVLCKLNPRLIVARMTGFRRDGKYKDMAGHDINYIAVSGVLSMLGRKGEKPLPPGNLLGDFAGGGAMCFMGILLALIERERGGRGQVVEANMVDGSAVLNSMPRFNLKTPMWGDERGTNVLDGGCPYYDTYETLDGKFMAVGCLEPQFFAAFLKGLGIKREDLPGPREDKKTWPYLKRLFTGTFMTKTRAQWERIFDGTDACCTPVFTHSELEERGYDHRPAVTLKSTPGFAIQQGPEGRPAAVGQGKGVKGNGWTSGGLMPGTGGEGLLKSWIGWQKGMQYKEVEGALELADNKAKL
ncbi:CoA-transferase family III [Pseudovirgaria hyperparasitica]|uniref:CoA-transferase family III n=1 Tax=Pseudovirgaria hyperparasitica TaxID=470096 RepID=A0A6A6VVQ6_9PEZI|nr:CoA-transferase family III [Pseudovirgaria hyperparasitica]KAF2754768.1 CoA-transferase family III [Pseudovirgaria hyperparasitica]